MKTFSKKYEVVLHERLAGFHYSISHKIIVSINHFEHVDIV